uniref:ribosomal protein S3 n=1 Tax=Cutaneotrichosporon mucoides TaxID=82522 RepID=UPI00226CF879|nr:ribosomal protein S3 [Cutaneotrichosporon mucoides]UZC57683.1 ribosomal protein S3 [Cutaneotrichosporon mucoides]
MNLLKKYNKEFFADKNVLNGNYNFYNGSERGDISMFNIQQERTSIIEKFFSAIKILSSKPKFNIGVNKVDINLFYYLKPNKNNKYEYRLDENTINNLGDLLSKLFKRQVELRFIKIGNPYLDRNILAQYIGKNASLYNFRRLKNTAIRNTNIIKYLDPYNIFNTNLPSNIIGLKIIFSGRLVTERLRPRMTVSTAKIGSFTSDKNLFIEYRSYTGKNTRGAFTVKVWINHKMGKKYI